MTRTSTPFGDIFGTVGSCVDNYPNIHTDQNASGQLVKLQTPALRAYADAERLNGRKFPFRKHRTPRAIRITGEGWRSCASQTALHNSDPRRFADPNGSLHCRGLAIDVENTPTNLTSRAVAALFKVGFHRPRSDEPWHFSFWENG